MKPSTQRLLLSISLLAATFLPARLSAQATFPQTEGESVRYTANIELPKGYLSGVCVLLLEDETVKGCLFNEFGITALSFTYSLRRDKVKLHDVVAMMDKWYIRRVLRRDLKALMHCLQAGTTQYPNERQHITYKMTPITEQDHGE